ncbi:hypothetical protein ACFQ2M_34775 [Kitasatospora saccharophila]|uniref:hypothetical protein n=1 Tax=Kitasatospora saccharophila TaxID=407973 RepID=UPI00362C53CB
MIRVGIVGASGLAGGELIRLVLQHPELELTFLGVPPVRGGVRRSCIRGCGWTSG